MTATTSVGRLPWLLTPRRPSNSSNTQSISTATTSSNCSIHSFSPSFSNPSFCHRFIFVAGAISDKIHSKEVEKQKKEAVEEEAEEELPWMQEVALDVVEFTGSITQSIPGPRVGLSSFPWILVAPLAYLGVSLVVAAVKTIRKSNSPKEIRRKLVNKNAELCRSIDKLFEKGGLQDAALKGLVWKTGFSMEEILRKYIRYALNEKPFNPELIAALIQLRKVSMLDDSQVAETLNEISRRIVKDKGPVVMDLSGYSEKGLRRKLAVQALFGKVFYLSELPEFCSRDSSLIVKEIFGVADEDAEKLRMHTAPEAGDIELLEKMLDDTD